MAEYFESYMKHLPGYLLECASGKFKKYKKILPTTYWAVFDPGGKSIYIASSENGMMWNMDLGSGKVIRKLHVGSCGNSLEFYSDNTLCWYRNGTVMLIKTPALQKSYTFHVRKLNNIFTDYTRLFVHPGMLIVDFKDTVYIVK